MLLLLCECISNISECFHTFGSNCDIRQETTEAEFCFSPDLEHQPQLLLVHLEVAGSPMRHHPELDPRGEVKQY